MSASALARNNQMKPRRPSGQLANANDAVLRATAVVSLLTIGTIHFLQIVPTTESTPLLGVAFIVLIAASVAVAGRLATHHDWRSWSATAGVSAAAIGGYIFTRTFSTPLDNQDAGNWACMLGLAAIFVETILLVMSMYGALIARPSSAVATVRPEGRASRKVAGPTKAA